MVGKDDPGVGAKGRAEPHLPNSVTQCLNLRHQQVRATVEQVDREEDRSTRNSTAAIVRHAREYALENGGMRSRFSALRLLVKSDSVDNPQPTLPLASRIVSPSVLMPS